MPDEDVVKFFPLCCHSRTEYEAWRAADSRSGGSTLFCTDCTESYAASMRLEGRCQHPEVIFSRVDGEYMGHVPDMLRLKSEYKGVSWSTKRQKWFAQYAGHGYSNRFLGYFSDEMQAKEVRDQFAAKVEAEAEQNDRNRHAQHTGN